MKKLTKILLLMPFTCAPLQLFAGSTTGNLPVSANILSSCAVNTGTGTAMAFGNYSGSKLQLPGSISVTCTTGTVGTIGLNSGSTGTSVTSRLMTNGATTSPTTLAYSLYTDPNYSINWNNVGAASGTVTTSGTGSAVSIPVYGQIAAGAGTTPGNYTDLVGITITY